MFEKDLGADKVDGADSTIEPDTNRSGGSRTANQDGGIENRQLTAPNVSTLTPGHRDGDASECILF